MFWYATNISTEKIKTEASSRISQTNAHSYWQKRFGPQAPKRPKKAFGLMGKMEWLKTQQDFESFRASKAYQTTLLKLRVHWSRNQNVTRFGFIIPKKVLPKVVDRNKLKRRLKTILLKFGPKTKPADVLLFPSNRALKLTFVQLEKEMELIFTQARLWKS
jgi:ribonuclease P protein component